MITELDLKVVARVVRNNYHRHPYICYLDGKKFTTSQCYHDFGDMARVVDEVERMRDEYTNRG